tara:strand:- start:66 stop:473 length:408 start_codon:yes stop_codon:yes gene_type:complete
MNVSQGSGGSLTFGYSEEMYFTEFMESIDQMKKYVDYLYDTEFVDIPNGDEETLVFDLDDTQRFYHNRDGDLIMCLNGIAYDTRCYAYFGIVNGISKGFLDNSYAITEPHSVVDKVTLLEVCDGHTDTPYYVSEH